MAESKTIRTAACVFATVFAVVATTLATATPTTLPATASWKTFATLAAPEANQAAATDETFVYAIGSKVIAKYDRTTAKRVAVSTGEATHLNSAFVWEGKLYCAHSNFPARPERSEIKRLDPKTMKLETYKDLGDFGGSLTFAVRRGDSWWCGFAYYGADNPRTYLVQFDERWVEKGRWTYPPAVTGKLGRYSISGAVWRDDELLVTGHDDAVLFQLCLPKEGGVLEYVGSHNVPFTGQGIAADPKTGGLVGINRKAKQIIFAVASDLGKGVGPTP